MPELLAHPVLMDLVARYGLWAVGVVVACESLGIPVPGETVLIAAALYSGLTGTPEIGFIIAAAAVGAIVGDNLGFLLGRRFGVPLLRRYGPRIGIGPEKIRLGRYLFDRFGAGVVFMGRFFAWLRSIAAFLAGTNEMSWPVFLAANAAGGILWAVLFGGGAYVLGQRMQSLSSEAAVAGVVLAVAALVAVTLALRRYGSRLQAAADRAYPGG
jgi:membrane protein DedA with SNARE-associated domain